MKLSWVNISRVCGCGPLWGFDPLRAANVKLGLTPTTPGAENPDVDILYPGSTSPCGHVPCVILLKGGKSQPHVQWLMCLTLHEMSLYSEAATSSSYLGCFAYCLPMHSWLTGTNAGFNERHFIATALWKGKVPRNRGNAARRQWRRILP